MRILNTLPFRGSGAVPDILFDEKYCIDIFLDFERPIICTTDSRNKKALPEYPHRGYSGSAFITTNAVVGGACRHSGCVNNATYLVMVQLFLSALLTTSLSFSVFSKLFLLPFNFLEALGVFNAAALFFKNIDGRLAGDVKGMACRMGY